MDYFLILVLFILVIVLFARVGELSQQIRELRSQLEKRKPTSTPSASHLPHKAMDTPFPSPVPSVSSPQTMSTSTTTASPAPPVPEPMPEPVLAPPPPWLLESLPTAYELPVASPVQSRASDPSPSVSRVAEKQAPPPSRSREEWELLIGGNLFNRIGAVALVIAIALFMKYAFDNGWISPMLRIVIGIVIGTALLWGGGHSHKKGLAIFAQGLIGAGIGTLYLSIYASYGFFHLIPMLAAFAAMFVVTLVAFWQSVRFDAQAICLLGLIGGLLTPIILRPDVSDPATSSGFGLCTYLLFLNIGLIAVMIKRDAWVIVEQLAMLGTYGLLLVWAVTHSPIQSVIPASSMLVYWLLYLGLHSYRLWQGNLASARVRLVMFWLNAIGAGFITSYLLSDGHHALIAPTLLVISIGYGVSGVLVARHTPLHREFSRYAIAAIIALTWATAMQLNGFLLAMAWAVEGLALVTASVCFKSRATWQTAVLLLGVAAIRLCAIDGALAYTPIEKFSLIFNIRCAAFLLLATAFLISAVIIRRRMDGDNTSIVPTVLHYAWITLLLILFTAETNDYFRHAATATRSAESFRGARVLSIAVVWLLYSLPLTWMGVRIKLRTLRNSGITVLAIGVVSVAVHGAVYAPIQDFVPLANLRAIALVVAIVGLVLQASWIARQSHGADWRRGLAATGHVLAAMLLFELVTVETIDFFRLHMLTVAPAWQQMCHFAIFAALPVVWTLYSVILLRLARLRDNAALSACALCAHWVAILFLGIITVQCSLLGDHYLPILNIRALAFAIVIMGGLLIMRQLKRFPLLAMQVDSLRTLLGIAMALLGFEMLTVEILDGFRWASHAPIADIPYLGNLCLAAGWVIYGLGLGWLGLRRAKTYLVAIGAGSAVLATCWVAAAGWTYSPLKDFMPLFNYRFGTFLLVMLAVGALTRLLHRTATPPGWMFACIGPFRMLIALLLFEVCTVETHDYFARAMLAAPKTMFNHLHELQQTSVSVVWLVLSVLLLIYGIWQKVRPLRVLAIAAFLFSIGKICLYYIVMPNMLYRIISFAGLGLTLLVASYLYQRYKHLILATDMAADKARVPAEHGE